MKNNYPTIALLAASLMISFSGAFRIAIAYLFIGSEIIILNVIAGFLIIYATYTFDRIIGGEEDKINRRELVRAKKNVSFAVCGLAFLASVIILFPDNLAFWAFFPFIVGYTYNKRINVGSFSIKLKGGLGMKNLSVALIWGATTAGIVLGGNGDLITTIAIFSFFFSKSFINTVLNDFRDITGDRAVGLMTLPIHLGEKNTRKLLVVFHIISHCWMGLMMILGQIRPEFVILLSCFIAGMIYIPIFTKPSRTSKIEKTFGNIVYKWEFMIAIGLMNIMVSNNIMI